MGGNNTIIFNDRVRMLGPGIDYGLRGDSPVYTPEKRYVTAAREVYEYKYAVVWTPRTFDGLVVRPFIAINNLDSTVLIDEKTHHIIAQHEYPMHHEMSDALEFVERYSAYKPSDFFNAAKILHVRRIGLYGLEVGMTQEQKKILEETHKGSVKFVRIMNDHWADPVFTDTPGPGVAQIAVQQDNYEGRLL